MSYFWALKWQHGWVTVVVCTVLKLKRYMHYNVHAWIHLKSTRIDAIISCKNVYKNAPPCSILCLMKYKSHFFLIQTSEAVLNYYSKCMLSCDITDPYLTSFSAIINILTGKLGKNNLLVVVRSKKIKSDMLFALVRWIRWHCPPCTGFEMKWESWGSKGAAPYTSRSQKFHTILNIYEYAEKKHVLYMNARAGTRKLWRDRHSA